MKLKKDMVLKGMASIFSDPFRWTIPRRKVAYGVERSPAEAIGLAWRQITEAFWQAHNSEEGRRLLQQ